MKQSFKSDVRVVFELVIVFLEKVGITLFCQRTKHFFFLETYIFRQKTLEISVS